MEGQSVWRAAIPWVSGAAGDGGEAVGESTLTGRDRPDAVRHIRYAGDVCLRSDRLSHAALRLRLELGLLGRARRRLERRDTETAGRGGRVQRALGRRLEQYEH